MSKVMAIATNTFREAIRNKIIYSVLAFAAAILACAAFFGSVSIGDRTEVITDFGLFGMSVSGMIITILLGVTLLNKELKQKTIYNILSKPLSRGTFIIGKHLGLAGTVIVLIAAMGMALYGFLWMLERAPSPRLALALYFISLEMLLLAGVVIFFSSMVVTTTLPGILALGTFVAGHSIDNFKDFARQVAKTNPGFARGVEVVSWIVPDLSIYNVNEQLLYNLPITAAYAGYATAYALCYTVLLLAFAVLIFEYKEFR